jgi:hypothetical protein
MTTTMATSTKGNTIRNIEPEIKIMTPGLNVMSHDVFPFVSANLASPTAFLMDGLRPILVECTIPHNSVDGVDASLPVPMVRPRIGLTDLVAPFLSMDIVGFALVKRFMTKCIFVVESLPFPILRDFGLGFIRMASRSLAGCIGFLERLGTSLQHSFSHLWRKRRSWFSFLGFRHFALCFFRRFLPFSCHDKSPKKTGLIRRKPSDIVSANGNIISILKTICQAGNAEPAGKIAQGFPGVCDGQG